MDKQRNHDKPPRSSVLFAKTVYMVEHPEQTKESLCFIRHSFRRP